MRRCYSFTLSSIILFIFTIASCFAGSDMTDKNDFTTILFQETNFSVPVDNFHLISINIISGKSTLQESLSFSKVVEKYPTVVSTTQPGFIGILVDEDMHWYYGLNKDNEFRSLLSKEGSDNSIMNLNNIPNWGISGEYFYFIEGGLNRLNLTSEEQDKVKTDVTAFCILEQNPNQFLYINFNGELRTCDKNFENDSLIKKFGGVITEMGQISNDIIWVYKRKNEYSIGKFITFNFKTQKITDKLKTPQLMEICRIAD